MQFIGGQGQLFNPEHGPVPLQDKTSFQLNLAQNEKNYLSHIDFDGDGIKDPAAYLILDESTGRYQQLMPPQTIEAATHVGIYFSSGVEADPDSGEPLPSLIRQLDRSPQFEDKGLVKSINAVDLEQTDLYVFRESNGQLVTSHKGVDRNSDDDVFNQGGNANGALAYSFLMRGPDDYWAAFSGFEDYAGWAAESKLAEPFQREVADHLRSGERLKLVAINRATGYMGTISFTSKDAGANGDVGNVLPMLTMYPPNLKIWAERVHEIKQGKQSSKDKTETNIIGNEGISLEDDLAVSIHTEWLDIDGRPLPAELEQYGYTARLAKVTTAPTPDVDALKQNGTNEFAIRPGRNLNVFKFNQKELSRHHYYVQVNPYPISEQNDFSYDLNGEDIYSPTHQNTSNPPWHGRSDMPAGSDEHDLPDLDAGTDADGNPITATHPLRFRPAHYVPFKVPLFDEQYTQVQQDLYDQAQQDNPDNNIKEPEPLYRWYYRPELQFSQYDFDAKSLIVKQTDSDGNESESSIDISEDGADFGAIFDEYTDSVELLFDLLGPELEPLPPLETEREFVLSLGGEEVLATIGQDGKVVFENPEHLNQLSEEDLLSLRLYLNGDSANVLWEYHLLGVSPFWSIYPNQLPQKIRKLDQQVEEGVAQLINLQPNWFIPNAYADPFNDERNVEHGESYLALGGMRIKLLFNGEDDSERKALYYRWSIVSDNANSKFYDSEKPEYNTAGELVGGANQLTRIWGAPEVWLEAGKWITNRETKIKLDVIYSISEIEEIEFTVSSRGLKPTSPEPMQGADVAMLESLLWQLGISPQKGSPGSEGARIASNRSGSGEIDTLNCQGKLADDRTKFYAGWSSCSSVAVSLEAMVRRFQRRNGLGQDGAVGTNTLTALKRDYGLYRKAAYEYAEDPIIDQNHEQFDKWLESAVTLWSEGSGAYVPAVYSKDIHDGILKLAGETDSSKNRKELLRNWIAHESFHHWGSNIKHYQATPFRMSEGGADEQGSLSFSQVLYTYRYGKERCDSHVDAGLNLYHPLDSVKTMAIHAVSGGNCIGGLNRAFAGSQTLAEPYETSEAAAENISDLVGYLKADGTLAKITAKKEDDYELLAKGVGIYNGALTWFRNNSWPFILKYFKHGGSLGENISNGRGCASCEYSIEIRNTYDGKGLGLPFRRYVWKGGEDLDDKNNNGEQDPGEEMKPWCFVYGEKEWLSPDFTVPDPNDTKERVGAGFYDYLKRAKVLSRYRIECL